MSTAENTTGLAEVLAAHGYVGRLAVEQAIAAVEARRERDAARAKRAARIAEGGDQ